MNQESANLHWLETPYVWVLAFSIILVLVHLTAYTGITLPEPLISWSGRLGASTISAYLVAVLIDREFREQERRRKQEIRQTAYTELQSILSEYIYLIGEMFTAASEERHPQIQTFDDLFCSQELDQIRLLNFASTCPRANLPESHTWLDQLLAQHEKTEEEINDLIMKYGFVMDSGAIDDLQSFSSSQFMRHIEVHRDIDSQELVPLLGDTVYDEFLSHLNYLEKACSLAGINLIQREIHILHDEKTLPKLGSGRYDTEVSVDKAAKEYQRSLEELIEE